MAALSVPARAWLRARSVNLLKSGSIASISARRGVASSGRPFSITWPVGRSVAGSMVITHTPSNGTARRRIRATASE